MRCSIHYYLVIICPLVMLSYPHCWQYPQLWNYVILLYPQLEQLTLQESTEGGSPLSVGTSVLGILVIANSSGFCLYICMKRLTYPILTIAHTHSNPLTDITLQNIRIANNVANLSASFIVVGNIWRQNSSFKSWAELVIPL